MTQSFVGKRTLVTDVYPLKSQKQFVNTLEDNIRFRGAMTKLISDYAKVEISNKVKDILRMYHSSSWNSEPYHQNQNPAGGRYCTLKSWTNTIMNRTGAPADCCFSMHDSCFLHPQSPLLRGIGWQCSLRDALWCFSRHQHHTPIHFLPTSVLCHPQPIIPLY